MFDKLNQKINHWFEQSDRAVNALTFSTYIIGMVLIHLFYFLAFFGIFYVNPEYSRRLTLFVEVIICLFLMIRFNPFREPKLSGFDTKIIFSSAIFLLTNIGVMGLFFSYIDKVKSNIMT